MKFLDSLIDYEKVTTYAYDAMKLDRMRVLLKALGNPQDSFQSIHIAGSRGKGSTCAMVYSILREAGFSVGLYTSPHLISRNERIRFAKGDEDRLITDKELAGLVAQIEPVVEELSAEDGGRFTFFEVFTALSFLFFKERKVDIAVLEVGMGGRLDATNIVRPLVAAVTPVSYDHTDKLGITLTEIAREKAEILKKGSIGVVSHQDREPLEEIRKVAGEKQLSLVDVALLYSYHIFEKEKEGTYFDVKGPHGDFHSLALPLLGEHQVRNALTAIAICEALSQKGHDISKAEIHRGLSKVDWPGRFQIVAEAPTIIMDGAQNGASAKALKETFLDLFGSRPLCLILGISADKEIEAVCKTLCPLADSVIVTQAQSSRALGVEALLRYASPYAKHLQVIPALEEALFWARTRFAPRGVILVTGSLYLVGEALALLKNEENERMGRERMSKIK